MNSGLTVYDSMETRESNLEQYAAFQKSVAKLNAAGITLHIIPISSAQDLRDVCDEAFDQVESCGMACLPLTVYEGTLVDSEEYPSDQILADYLDVPDGVLSANKYSMPAANDREFSCCECRKN